MSTRIVSLSFFTLLPSLFLASAPGLRALEAAADVAALMPAHGTVSTAPARDWENALAAGNGIMGAMLYGDPAHDTLLVNHCKLWLPAGSREILPDAGQYLAEMRRIIGQKGYAAGQKFFLEKARESGWGGSIVWTDAFHPGFFLKINEPASGPVTDYARVEDFSTGEVRAQWRTPVGDFARRLFVSRVDNTIVCTTTGPAGKVSLGVRMEKLGNPLIDSAIAPSADGWITCHNIYVKGKGGYDGAVRIVNRGGARSLEGDTVTVTGADSVTLLIRVLPWRTPLPGSQAWPNDPANPDFARPRAVTRDTVQIPGRAYDPAWMAALKADLASMPADYAALLKPAAALWRSLFGRVSVDLGGAPADRALSSEALLARDEKAGRLSSALLERMYDAGRYVFMCSAGPETPPGLFGIWTGTWTPAWSGDYTTDTNLQLDTELAYSANLADLMRGYFHFFDSVLPDLRRNARSLYGCRGILIGSRASNNGLALHWSDSWPGNLWTPGAAWMAHWYYDYYLYTGDRAFLRDTAIPWMKDCALFYEDFLKGTEDPKTGKYTFRPSYSAENGWGDNASQDIEIATQLLTNLIQGCETLGIEKDNVVRWKALLAKLPPLLVNKQGQLKEWSNPTQGEQNNHRHLMHLYGAFDGYEFSPDKDARLYAAAEVALWNRVNASKEDATHGFMQTALAATTFGLGDLAFARVEELVKHRSIYVNLVDAHYGGPRILCDDGNGATPEIIDRMFVQSEPGRLTLLPAVPHELPKGSIRGLRARGAISIDRIAWDMPAGTCRVTLTADSAQTIALALPGALRVKSIIADGDPRPVTPQGVASTGLRLALPQGAPVTLDIAFAPGATTSPDGVNTGNPRPQN